MVEKIGHIKNPLTVIAMFAAIAEVSGALVLPFISPANQATYIWFLMIFPVLLIAIFFVTLNFNHKVLYAPSDWKDEANFFRKFSSATAEEKEEKITEEATSATQAQEDSPAAPAGEESVEVPLPRGDSGQPLPTSGSMPKPVLTEFRLDASVIKRYRGAESRAVRRIATELALPFEFDVAVHPTKNRKVIFDAVAIEQNRVTAIETRVLFGPHMSRMDMDRMLLQAESVARTMRESGKEFVFHYVLISPGTRLQRDRLEEKVRLVIEGYDVNVRLQVRPLSEFDEANP